MGSRVVKQRIWTGAAGTNEWNQPENWAGRTIPIDGENVSIVTNESEMTLAPNAPANLNVADLYVAGNIEGGPVTVRGAFYWESGRITADLELKTGGSVMMGEGIVLSGRIESTGNLVFEGDDQMLLDGGEVACADSVQFTNCGLRAVSDAPSRFTSRNFYIHGAGRFSGKSLVVERMRGGLLRVDGELEVDEGAKLVVPLGILEGRGFLNITYDATMDLEQGVPANAEPRWFFVTPWHTTARFGLEVPGKPEPVDLPGSGCQHMSWVNALAFDLLDVIN